METMWWNRNYVTWIGRVIKPPQQTPAKKHSGDISCDKWENCFFFMILNRLGLYKNLCSLTSAPAKKAVGFLTPRENRSTAN